MEHTIGKTLKLREDLTLVAIEDAAALLDVDRRRYFDPNDTASFLLKRMEDGCLYEDLKVALVTEFAVDEETARLDIDDFVGELVKLGLVEVGEGAITHKAVIEPKGQRQSYRAPRLLHGAEIALITAAQGPGGPTIAPSA